MGLSALSDEWCCRSDRAIEGLSGLLKIVDHIIVTARTPDILEKRTRQVFERCRADKITISWKKFQVNTSVKFAGHIISAGTDRGGSKNVCLTVALTSSHSQSTNRN